MTERGGAGRSHTDKPAEDASAAPYRGALGRTRSETHAVWMSDGAHRLVEVWVSVDAEAYPELAELACKGALHALPDGGQLAVPFVYHDPRVPLFALVVPEALRHRVLALRAELLSALAQDMTADVPPYVAEAGVVVGTGGLMALLPSRPDDAAPVDDGELDELDAPEPVEAGDVREADGEPGEAPLLDDVGAVVVPELSEAEVSADELEALDGLEAGDALAVSDEPPPGAEPSRSRHPPGAAPTEALRTQQRPRPSHGELAAAEYARPSDIEALEPSLVPPPVAPEGPSRAWLALEDERVWLYVRGGPGEMGAGSDVDVLLQRRTDRGPALVLSVVFDALGAPEVRRGVIEPQDPAQHAALTRLADSFELELVSLSAADEPLHLGTLYAPREANVRDLLGWFERAHAVAPPLTPAEHGRTLDAAPPWRELTHPFQAKPRHEGPLEATEAAVALDELALWLTPERLEHVRLDLSVSDELIELRVREGLGHALDVGLALDPVLATRALALGLAADEGGLLARRIAGLCRTSAEAEHGGIPDDVLRTLWAEVLELAPRLGVALTPEVEAHAARYAGQRALEHARVLARHTDDALGPLRRRFEEGERSPGLLGTLAAQGGVHDIVAALSASADAIDAPLLPDLFAQLLQRGGVVGGDAALALLASAQSVTLRVGAAAVLAGLRATSALPELVQRLGVADEPEARALAWCLGRYGVGSFRAVCRVLATTPVPREREAWVLASLVQHGARAQVRARARSQSAPEAQLAAHALELANQLKETGNPFVGLEQQGALTVFFESFDRARQAAGEHGSGGVSGVGVDSAGVVP